MGSGNGHAAISNGGQQVLVIDDDRDTRDVVARALTREGFRVGEAADGPTGLDALSRQRPDLVILDVGLPGIGGFDLLTRIRATLDVPVIMLTARDAEADRVLGLELGADDYVVKPFSPRELASRVRSVLRRSRPAPADAKRMDFDGLVVDPATREVLVDAVPVVLTAKEFDLLAFLATTPRRVFSRSQLLEQVWQSSAEWQDPATVTEHVRRIRLKIEPDPEHPRWVQTARGVGYRFNP